MSGADAIEGVKSKGNKAIANHAFNQHIAAQDRAMMYEVEKKKLMSSGVPESKAIKMAEEYIKKSLGSASNDGSQNNNKTKNLVSEDVTTNQRVLGQTGHDGEKIKLVGSSENSDNNQDNMAGDQKRPTTFDKTELSTTNTATLDFTKSLSSFSQKMVAKILTRAGITPTEHLAKAIASLSDKEADDLVAKLQKKGSNEMMREINKLTV